MVAGRLRRIPRAAEDTPITLRVMATDILIVVVLQLLQSNVIDAIIARLSKLRPTLAPTLTTRQTRRKQNWTPMRRLEEALSVDSEEVRALQHQFARYWRPTASPAVDWQGKPKGSLGLG
jgi:hypothetical protein